MADLFQYTWGSTSSTKLVQINGKPFYVHINLYNLLHHLRHHGESRWLWIDAICIDQANLAERNFHVKLMAQIYVEAQCALVWLGLPSDDRREARAIDFVGQMAEILDKKSKKGGPTFADLFLNEQSVPRWANLLTFCREPGVGVGPGGNYWSRTWIIQGKTMPESPSSLLKMFIEFVQARDIEINCGTAKANWEGFAKVFAAIRQRERDGKVPPALSDIFSSILRSIPSRLSARRLSAEASPLEALLHEFYDAQCSEPRDKVYGMLGIAKDCGEHPDTGLYRGPQPDYAKHIVDVYLDVIAYLRYTSGSSSVSPLTVKLLQKSLRIGPRAIFDYANKVGLDEMQIKLPQSSFLLRPEYINVVEDTISSWTSSRDLKQSLELFDWSKYVGYTIERKSSRSNPSSPPPLVAPSMLRSASSTQQVVNATPEDMIQNVIALAEVHPSLSTLYNYLPHAQGLHLPLELLSMHHDDKCLFSGITQKPSIIVEQSESAVPLRIGFAPPGTRRGDLICQFPGIDLTLIVRRPVYGSQGLQLVGRAIMVKHAGLNGLELETHPVCSRFLWASTCLAGEIGVAEHSAEVLETDAFSMFEIMNGGQG
jgi:hypothetical protein